VPAPAVIPAPIAYIKVVAVKKLVVGLQSSLSPGPLLWCALEKVLFLLEAAFRASLSEVHCARSFTLKKLECLKQAFFA